MNVGDLFKTKSSGVLKITKISGARNISVVFVDTGFESATSAQSIRNGTVKDLIKRVAFGVGFIGVGKHKSFDRENGKLAKPYTRWRGMLERCYSERYQSLKPTYIGCKVCNEWHNFQNFADWFDKNYIEGFELDKDKLGNGKLYSPDTCCFISRAENVEISQSKSYVLKYKDGSICEFFNLSKFCRDNGLTSANIHKVLNGSRNQHKGWTIP